MSLLRTFHTVRHLRPIQVINRIARRFRNVAGHVASVGDGYRLVSREAEPPARPGDHLVEGQGFRFLDEYRPHEGEDRWEPRGAARLWTYQLHTFTYLGALEPARARAQVLDWIKENPPVEGPGWEPYTISLRIREWIEWLHKATDLASDARHKIVESIAQQAAGLEAQVEHHLLANHLLENAISLCWVGLSLEGPAVERWLRTGLKLLERELSEQVLGDGTHYERSPMYQALIAEPLLRLGGVAASSTGEAASRVRDLCRRVGVSMVQTLGLLTHPDGDYALVNDTSLGSAPTLAELSTRFSLKLVIPEGAWHLQRAGYMGMRSRDGTYLIFDAGDIGPAYQPGHGHADTLSLELSHRGERLLTDTGIHTYAVGNVRLSDRGTAAHNTVEIDGRNQAELWGAFRCGRRPRITGAGLEKSGNDLHLSGAYKCPGGLLRPTLHDRTLRVVRGSLLVQDRIRARGSHRATSRLHLAPGVEAAAAENAIRLSRAGRSIGTLTWSGPPWQVATSVYHPSFGIETERVCLCAPGVFRDELELGWKLQFE